MCTIWASMFYSVICVCMIICLDSVWVRKGGKEGGGVSTGLHLDQHIIISARKQIDQWKPQQNNRTK